MPALRIATARPENAQELAALHVLSWQSAYAGIIPAEYLAQLSVDSRAASWREWIERGELCLLAWEDEAPAADGPRAIGFVSCGKCRDPDRPDTWGEIWAIYVLPSHWSQGVGRALWLHACGQLRQQGFTHVSVWVLAGNERAIRFYRRAGLEADAGVTKPIEIGGQTLVELRYHAGLP